MTEKINETGRSEKKNQKNQLFNTKLLPKSQQLDYGGRMNQQTIQSNRSERNEDFFWRKQFFNIKPLQVFVVIFWGMLSAVTIFAEDAQSVKIVVDGRPYAAIVIPSKPSKETKEAAHLLQTYIEKCSDVKLEIFNEQRYPVTKYKSMIYLGDCLATTKIINTNKLKPEEIVIKTEGTDLYISGGDNGVIYGVYYWLRRYLGIRWIFPGESGEVIPKRLCISMAATNYTYQPAVKRRELRNLPWTNTKTAVGIKKICEKTKIHNTNDILNDVKEFYSRKKVWSFMCWGAGSRLAVKFGHSYGGYWDKYGKDHPDFFALQPNGSREQYPQRERLCVSNPGLWEIVAQQKIEEFRNNPEQQMASIAPNDGNIQNKFCMCEKCRSWDPPDAPKIQHHPLLINPKTKQPFDEYPSLSDRYFRFYNEVAKRVLKVYPDKTLGVYAYSVYQSPPLNIDQLQPNIVVALVSLDQEYIHEWSKLTSRLHIRPNYIAVNNIGFSQAAPHWLAETLRFAIKCGVEGFDFDKCAWNWGTQGLDYYVLMHIMWDPSLDVDNLIEDYCSAAYGSGADEMKKFWLKLERITTSIREDGKYKGLKVNPLVLTEYYPKETLSELQAYINRAKDEVGKRNTDLKQYKRIAIAEEGLNYTRWACRILRSGDKSDAKQIHNQFFEFLAKSFKSYAINPGYNYFYLSMAEHKKKTLIPSHEIKQKKKNLPDNSDDY